MIGIFPVTYVEMIPNENVGSLSRKSSAGGTLPRGGSGSDQLTEGKGKAKFNFQVSCQIWSKKQALNTFSH